MVHEPYGAIGLTEEGERLAIQLSRRHRILEMFLVTELGYSWDEIHDEAEVLEHAVTERFIDRLDARLGHPRADPHGDVIPSADGQVAAPEAVRLSDVTSADPVRVVRVSDEDPATLRYLAGAGIVPGAPVSVVPDAAAPHPAELTVRVAGRRTTVGVLAAEAVWVLREPASAG